MNIPANLMYTKTHEWARREDAETVVGITEHAQQELRDVVFVELPPVGKTVKQGEPVAVVESVKAAFDIYAPISGRVSRVNSAVVKSPQVLNQDCYGAGWLYAITHVNAEDFAALLSASDYAKAIEAEAH